MITNETLAKLDLFAELPDTALGAIANLCQETSFTAGATIFAIGHPADRIYLLLEGQVKLALLTTPLPEPTTITLLQSRGQAFGWSAIVGSGHYTALAQATTDVQAIAIDGKALMTYLTQHTDVGFVVMRRIAQTISQRLGSVRRLLMETIRECDSPAEAEREN